MEDRPDPDALLKRIEAEEARAPRGKLKIFFGASAGVGKTFAMLAAARRMKEQGVDVVIGVVETHGRVETETMAQNIERVPLRQVRYRDRTLPEFDLDATLERRPALVLVDELAHSNVPGSRHPKRWQDVEELLAAGIDVYSTVNVQHLETLSEVVGGIAGIRVLETVPEHVFDGADEVVLVDLPPDELLQRLKEGKVYVPDQAQRAVASFFRKGNLIALRELALRRTADRVDADMLTYRRSAAVSQVWQTQESLLVCIGPDGAGEKLLRSAARFAARLNVPWHAVYVETPKLQRLSEARRHGVLRALRLARDMGAETATLAGSDEAEVIVKYARDHNLANVVVGRNLGRKRAPWQRSFADRVGMAAPELDVIQTAPGLEARPRRGEEEDSLLADLGGRFRAPWPAYGKAAGASALVALLAAPLHDVVELTNVIMLFLLAVVVVAVRYGRGPAVAAAVLSVAAFDFLYVPPRFTFAVSDVQYLMTFAVMLVVALVIGQLTADLTYQAKVANRREARVRALYTMSRDLSAALLPDQISEIVTQFIKAEFDTRAAVLAADANGALPAGDVGLQIDRGVAQWAFDHGEPAGHGTDTLPGSALLYLPLRAPMRIRGVLAVEPRPSLRFYSPEQLRLLETCASLVAITLERLHYVDVAQTTTLQIESERLRNSLLAAISHDLRTPLSVLMGLAESLVMTRPGLTDAQRELTEAMTEEIRRMTSLVENLLDMARLQSGRVELDLQWHPLEEVVGSALKALEPMLAGREVQVRLPEDLPLLRLDAPLMQRVFSNLLENAVKYTPPGSVIGIAAAANEQEVEISVSDDGPGLPRGKEERLFDKFERGQRESPTPGVGLGLAICRAIVEAHGGRIRASNRAEGGARFSFTVPRGTPPIVPVDEPPGDREP